ncbi:hypothetical protein JM79_2047 [Gramella sp. Hel_I_59]|uniref:FEKKY domain-containing protein n=1 Tax=Gramella sp. Hel_I_59 TaxID=1249978 RepID=UPI0011503A6C|nr:hypothetical protein [Gramella sp. Hel_I_59]TQI71121.1 hypothetical protein JM79_2047 [Gramella sp. Hel_I_59]
MKKVIIILTLIFSNSSFAQENGQEEIVFSRIGNLTDEQINSSGPAKLLFAKKSEIRNLAKQDLENGNPFLLLQGGIAPVIIATDPQFEDKYKIYFYEYGCTGPDQSLIEDYNKIIFSYLTDQYGKKWIKEVRDDVVGLNEWKKLKR